ncbi:MAG: MFS transporter [Terriglobia bacterium]
MPEKRWIRVISIAFIMYTIAYIDRTNISLALPSLTRDLHLTSTEAGDAVGIFFWGYLLLQIPGGYFATRWSAKRFVSVLLVVWGCCAALTSLVHTGQGLLWMRFLLGVAEGGVWPATLVLLSNWFPSSERARANAYWMLCLPAAVVFSSPLSGWILGRWNWRVLLVVEGVFPLIWVVVWWLTIDDYPRQARWISATERDFLEQTISREKTELHPSAREPYLRLLLRPHVLLMVLIYFLQNSGNYGYLFWLPSAIEHTHKISNLRVGFLFTIPYLLAGLGMILISRSSDKTGDRPKHVAFALAWGGIFLVASVLTSASHPLLSFFLIIIVGFGPYGGLGPFWAIPTETLPASVAGSAMGLINALGNLGGFFGPLLVGYLRQRTGGFVYPFAILGVGWLIAAALAGFFLPNSRKLKATMSAT